jgi:hypothetical protein
MKKAIQALSLLAIGLFLMLGSATAMITANPWVDHILGLKAYQQMYSPARLQQYRQKPNCPNCDAVVNEEMVILSGGQLPAGHAPGYG